jgi:AraC-like DNA-binding protein
MDCGTALIAGSLTYSPADLAGPVSFGADGCTLLRIGIGAEGLSEFGVSGRQSTTLADHVTIGGRIRRELQCSDAAAKLALRSAVLHLIGRTIRLFRDSGTKPPWLVAAREFIAARFREPLRPADVAAAAGVSEARLSAAFRAELGTTVGGAIRMARVEAATRELCRSDASVMAVAARCGFYDTSHLIRAFEAVQGVTPTVFRKGGAL